MLKAFENTVLRRDSQRVSNEAGQDQQARDDAETLRIRIELGIADKTELLDRAARQIARGDELNLAADQFGVEPGRRFLLHLGVLRAGEEVFLILEQHFRFSRVARFDHVHEKDGEQKAEHRRDENPKPLPVDRGSERTEVEVVGARVETQVRLEGLSHPQPRESVTTITLLASAPNLSGLRASSRFKVETRLITS